MKTGHFFLLTVIVLLSAWWGCKKNNDWPPEPSIEFIDFVQPGNDTAWLIFSFRDGDGDLGVTDPATDSSIIFRYIEVVDGVAHEIPLLQEFNYDMPNITPAGRNKAIEGEIHVLISPYYMGSPDDFDAIRYKFYLKDRAGNHSNTVETPDIIVTP